MDLKMVESQALTKVQSTVDEKVCPQDQWMGKPMAEQRV